MKKRSVAILAIILVAIGVVGTVALLGMPLGKLYRLEPWANGIKQGLDLTGGVSAVYQVKNQEEATQENINTAMQVFRTRLDSEGYPEATVAEQEGGRIRIEIPINDSTGSVDPNEVTQYLVATAKVTFVDPEGNVLFEGKDMETVGVSTNEANEYVVAFKLNSGATRVFAEATAAHQQEAISIYLDDTMISQPIVNEVIATGEGSISGGFTYESASKLANQIRSGVMPIELEEIEVRSISATLGDEALEKGILAGAIGLGLVMIFMVVMYRLSGVVADIALCVYVLLVLLAMATIDGVQLTLPGIAGIILAIGMAVDANIIIFERMREEMVSGRSVRSAITAGFKRALSAILDSNVTTIIAALVLLFFGTGSIKGFATTLLIGIIASFITAVFVTRGLMTLFSGITNKPELYMRRVRREKK